MSYIPIVPYNRELLVINDMEVFAGFFCYAKKQKKGLVPTGRPATVTGAIDRTDESLYEHIEDSDDKDLLPVTNIGFRG